MATKPLAVAVEQGGKKTFASALDWPGWSRSGRNEEAALEALASYADRYAEVARQAGLTFPSPSRVTFDVVEHLPGDAGTDFGIPSRTAEADRAKLTPAAAQRQAALVAAAWAVFDAVAATAPEQLRKGPRGGGRDRDKMIGHVLEAEAAYGRLLGVRLKPPAIDDLPGIEANREALLTVLSVPSDGGPLREKGWTSRYAARRIAWHALDHAWEMQDRAE
jgi:hypothetical protein